MSEVTADLIDL